MPIGYLAPPSAGGDFDPAPAGTVLATCFRVVDLGTQETNFQGRISHKPMLMLSWELHCDEKMNDGRPFMISKRYTYSMHEKATFRHDLESWRGRAFAEADFAGPPNGFHVKKLLGVPCILNVVHKENGDKTYANVSSVSKLMKGMTPPPLVNEIAYLSLDPAEFDQKVFDSLSDYVKGLIMKTDEWDRLTGKKKDIDPPPLEHGDPGPALDDTVPFDHAGGHVAPPARTPAEWRAVRDRMKAELKNAPSAKAVNDMLVKWSTDDSLRGLRQFDEDMYDDVMNNAGDREHYLAMIEMERSARLAG